MLDVVEDSLRGDSDKAYEPAPQHTTAALIPASLAIERGPLLDPLQLSYPATFPRLRSGVEIFGKRQRRPFEVELKPQTYNMLYYCKAVEAQIMEQTYNRRGRPPGARPLSWEPYLSPLKTLCRPTSPPSGPPGPR